MDRVTTIENYGGDIGMKIGVWESYPRCESTLNGRIYPQLG